MTRIMRDSDAPAAIPIRGTDIAAGYVTGEGTWPAQAFVRFRRIEQARIDARGTKPRQADILDVEDGCAPVSRAASWVKERKAAFPGAYPPVIYCNQDTLKRVLPAMRAAGLRRVKDYRLWIATLDGTKRIPDMRGVIAVQYKHAPDMVNGKLEAPGPSVTPAHFDESIVFDDDWHPGDDFPYTEKKIQGWVKKGVAAELSASATQKQILDMVKMGVAAELSAPIDRSGITPAQGAQAAVGAQAALGGLVQQLADVTALVKALPAATPAPAGPQPPAGLQAPAGPQAPAGTGTPAGKGAAPRAG
jgi:hypothetical protein